MKKLLSLALLMIVLAVTSCNRKGYCPAYNSSEKPLKKA
ncbi:hypothetical protein Runsl_3739 [Runella slithyformis DSM 19594]|uniref:Uncharacterized protein n=1 Tax=Runella slithyformis (strain ATCC 29530 / DSM 19594 / LMG 11500 / NCIMB 11436 / LSU 4) TaxID=761193 RepID=A0A7U3ZMT1_RUNSL|nr:hypothetical protein Runsl_3739 [Runella slithyformis DSM 19594]